MTDSDNLSPVTCNETLLAGMAASAQQIDTPIAPFPRFFSNSTCGGGSGSSFPSFFLPVSCPEDPDVLPDPITNCLRIISVVGKDIDSVYVKPNQVNELKHIIATAAEPKYASAGSSNIFPGDFDKLYSFYIPPQYKAVFFSSKIGVEGKSVGDIFKDANTYSQVFGGNHLEVDTCRTKLMLINSSKFTEPIPFISDILNTTEQKFPTSDMCLNNAVASDKTRRSGDQLNTTAPYFILLQTEEFNDMIIDMCVSGRDVVVGTNSLSRVWYPQSSGCDKFMTNLCQISSIEETKYKETCSCYQQKIELDQQFGEDLKVPVCCFGKDPSGDIDLSCAFNSKSYKTKEMLTSCCSFAQCEKAVVQGNMGNTTDESGVLCQGTFVEFPKINTTDIPKEPVDTIVVDSDIPVWVWGFFGAGTILLLLFVIALSFL